MANEKNFSELYENELQDLLIPLETERKKISKIGVTGFLLLVVAIVLFIVSTAGQLQVTAIIAFISLIGALILFVFFTGKKKSHVASFKKTIVSRIINFIDSSFQYSPTLHISKNEYIKSGLYIDKPERFSGDDYIEGTRGKTFFCFSELHTEKLVSTGKSSHWETIFKGLFFISDFNKNFAGRTYAWSEKKPQLNFLTKFFSSFALNLEEVKLESIEFEKKFNVYSSDQVEARYILSPSFMERMVKLQTMMGSGISFSFIDTNIYVAVPIREKLFEPTIYSPNNYERLGDYYNTVQIVFDIIDELKLNDRLWNKE